MGKSTALVSATRTQVTDEESQVSRIGSVVEEEESEISLKTQRCLNHVLVMRISLYGSRILILMWRIENNFFVDF
jgi:hypothetical protein